MADAAALDPPRLAERIDRLRLDLLVQSIRRAPVWLLLPFNAFCARLLWRSGWRGWRGWSGVCGSAATSAWPPRVYALCSLMLGGAMVCGWLAHRDGLGVGVAVLVAGLTLLLVQQVGAQQQARQTQAATRCRLSCCRQALSAHSISSTTTNSPTRPPTRPTNSGSKAISVRAVSGHTSTPLFARGGAFSVQANGWG